MTLAPTRATRATRRALRCLLLLCAAATAPLAAQAFDDGTGREWMRLSSAARPTWEQVATVCPTDGTQPCIANLPSLRLKDWVWATAPQVQALLALYAPAMADPNVTEASGFDLFAVAQTAHQRHGITFEFSFCTTYQGCSSLRESTGMTATLAYAGSPAVALAGRVASSNDSGGASFSVNGALRSDLPYGVWAWRPTGLNTGQVHAYDDAGSPAPGATLAVPNVMANDWVAGQRATTANATLTELASSVAGLSLDTATGAVNIAPGLAAGDYTLTYRLCSRAAPGQCDDAEVTVTVRSFALVARNDAGSASFGAGGRPIANVLANDTVGGVAATTGLVALSQVSSTHAGLSLNVLTGAVDVAPGTPSATHSLVYRICERANPANCVQATATVVPYVIDAVDDYRRASSKTPAVLIANVLANDRFGGQVATTAQVTITLTTAVPYGITFDTTTGQVRLLRKVDSMLYVIGYRICERGSPGNCDTANVSLDLSGGL
jgi:hypothetical protein